MHPLQESWDRTTAHLKAARDLLPLDQATLADVDDWLTHNELGLALDVLVDAGEKRGDAAPVSFWTSLQAAVVEMQIDPDDPVHATAAREVLRRSGTES